jgi:hypothetical protein
VHLDYCIPASIAASLPEPFTSLELEFAPHSPSFLPADAWLFLFAQMKPRLSSTITQPLRTHTHNRLTPQPARPESSSACSYPPLRRSIIAPLELIDIMASLLALVTAMLWKIFFFALLHTGSQTLADDAPAAGQCYYPNGDVTESGWPCTDDGSPSNCCSAGFVCMNTGVCKLKGVDYYERQSCADIDWGSSSCSRMCTMG